MLGVWGGLLEGAKMVLTRVLLLILTGEVEVAIAAVFTIMSSLVPKRDHVRDIGSTVGST
jgi:hypothetical protein